MHEQSSTVFVMINVSKLHTLAHLLERQHALDCLLQLQEPSQQLDCGALGRRGRWPR